MHSLNLLWTAHNENAWERRQKRLSLRRQLEKIEDIPELLFTQHFRLDKSTFTQLCDELKVHTELKGSLEITLEVKCHSDIVCEPVLPRTGATSNRRYLEPALPRTGATSNRCCPEPNRRYLEPNRCRCCPALNRCCLEPVLLRAEPVLP
ncbi:hypothetical protein ACJJTC_014811 [Scirpophaga incertulas]